MLFQQYHRPQHLWSVAALKTNVFTSLSTRTTRFYDIAVFEAVVVRCFAFYKEAPGVRYTSADNVGINRRQVRQES